MTEFLSDVEKVKINSNKLILVVKNEFSKQWIEVPTNIKQLKNIIAEYVDVPNDFIIECESEGTIEDINKVTKRYNDLTK